MNTMRIHLVPSAVCLAVLFALAAPSPAQDVLGSHEGNTAGGRFGTVARAGDVDADGVGDWIVGAPADSLGGTGAGSVRVVSGADGAVLHEWLGFPGDALGSSVSAMGDVDADGFDDIVAGAPGSHGGTTGGYARIWSGGTGQALKTITGAFPGGGFGRSVVGIGDVSGDNRPDLAVGAPQEDNATGRVYLLSGASGTLIGVPLTGQGQGDLFGAALAYDMDVVVSAGDSDGGLVIGATQGGPLGGGYVDLIDLPTQALIASVPGDVAGEAFGGAVSVVGDIDGDGIADVAAGSTPPGAAPRVRLISGADGNGIAGFANGVSGGGLAVCGAGDVDGDGVPDLAVGEPRSDVNGTDSGTLRSWSGADGALLHVVHGPEPGAAFAASVALIDDLDGDGRRDLAVGAPEDGAGKVYLLSLRPYDDLGAGLPGGSGIPRLSGLGGELEGAEQVTLVLDDARPLADATLVAGFATYVDMQQGGLAPMPDLVESGLLTDVLGRVEASIDWSGTGASGATVYYQFRVADPLAPGGTSCSNTVAGNLD